MVADGRCRGAFLPVWHGLADLLLSIRGFGAFNGERNNRAGTCMMFERRTRLKSLDLWCRSVS